ncbi:hypothetical protein K458DRAFT_383595 [Lentithecium fluviatile CBS 122367]|uniref:Uncharacterized protein n=1 Tax=Lentithecium fluviatile CBS 122367 TaxID=1168545 RepID=A0A6G1JK17_9PLEO|nr:hypothetical protein K458DRAFT_383595 [Lentithecium fluviatile CBS 122367]
MVLDWGGGHGARRPEDFWQGAEQIEYGYERDFGGDLGAWDAAVFGVEVSVAPCILGEKVECQQQKWFTTRTHMLLTTVALFLVWQSRQRNCRTKGDANLRDWTLGTLPSGTRDLTQRISRPPSQVTGPPLRAVLVLEPTGNPPTTRSLGFDIAPSTRSALHRASAHARLASLFPIELAHPSHSQPTEEPQRRSFACCEKGMDAVRAGPLPRLLLPVGPLYETEPGVIASAQGYRFCT